MKGTVMATIALALLPTPLFAYIGSGFKSAAAYREHLRTKHAAKIGRATEAIRRDPKDAVA
jgi:quinol monooxygenase YgiN